MNENPVINPNPGETGTLLHRIRELENRLSCSLLTSAPDLLSSLIETTERLECELELRRKEFYEIIGPTLRSLSEKIIADMEAIVARSRAAIAKAEGRS